MMYSTRLPVALDLHGTEAPVLACDRLGSAGKVVELLARECVPTRAHSSIVATQRATRSIVEGTSLNYRFFLWSLDDIGLNRNV